ncbi:cell cycle checkpoint control protein RAD9A [Stomoxys calcitrans]|uniref:cell cycle checkpoint control protein RAD9A n=1 Tax=Stomoxys calcitrans TaxID=35570 RepID=UPI0027E302C6|nr:cell cycle checkpoint control protein RAD9A [Stomoxys calcitrans]
MKCTLEGGNARVIAKAIQSLAKFGSDLYMETDAMGLQLRTFNLAKSAMGTFRFNRTFFETYNEGVSNTGNYCKVTMKTILPVFKNMKQVERCEIQLLPEVSKLQIQFKCRMETMKNRLISIVDEENVTAAVSQEETSNVIVGPYKVFNDILNHFNAAEVEMTLEAMGNELTAKNYIEGARVSDKFMRSRHKISPSEFDTYNVREESAITFSLKEFRSFLLFAENIGESLTLNFNEAGGPIFLTIKKLDLIECTLVMTTVYPDDVSMYDDCRESEVKDTTHTSNHSMVATQKRKHSNTKASSKESAPKKRLSEETTLSSNSTLFQFNTDNTNIQSIEVPRNVTQQDIDMGDEQDDLLLAAAAVAEATMLHSNTLPPVRESEVYVTFESSESNRNRQDSDGEETIPQSPEREHQPKLRSIFSRCFESTYVPKEPSPSSQVYVPNSDTED